MIKAPLPEPDDRRASTAPDYYVCMPPAPLPAYSEMRRHERDIQTAIHQRMAEAKEKAPQRKGNKSCWPWRK